MALQYRALSALYMALQSCVAARQCGPERLCVARGRVAAEGPGSLLFLLSRGGGYTGRRNFYLFTLASWLTLSPLWLAGCGGLWVWAGGINRRERVERGKKG